MKNGSNVIIFKYIFKCKCSCIRNASLVYMIYDGIHNIRWTDSINVKTHSDSNKTNSETYHPNAPYFDLQDIYCVWCRFFQ
jgi:hypothetical protein